MLTNCSGTLVSFCQAKRTGPIHLFVCFQFAIETSNILFKLYKKGQHFYKNIFKGTKDLFTRYGGLFVPLTDMTDFQLSHRINLTDEICLWLLFIPLYKH